MIDVVTPGRLGAMLKAKFGEKPSGIQSTDDSPTAAELQERILREVRERLQKGGENTKSSFSKSTNCGTGAGGFQPGNTCASGGGSSVLHDKLSKLSGNRDKREKDAKRLLAGADQETVRGFLEHNDSAVARAAKSTLHKLENPKTTEDYLREFREQENADKEREARKQEGYVAARSELERLGYRLEHQTPGSDYYHRESDNSRVRVSDHNVPSTGEREHNTSQGGFSWANAPYVSVHGGKEDVLAQIAEWEE